MILRTSTSQPHLGGNFVGGDPNTLYVDLWSWLVQQYQAKSVFDVGCGEGYAMREFLVLGCEVVGIDGLQENVDTCAGLVVKHDLVAGPYQLSRPADLVWCCELVEHVDERHVNNVLVTLAQGIRVAMTHALPRQRGYHHVNCKDDQYWISALRSVGYEYLESDTKESRELFNHAYWGKSGLIFERIIPWQNASQS